MASERFISIADEFSDTPFGRDYADGDESGQRFREEWLIPALQSGANIVLNIDGVAGLPSSFWEESLGGLVRAGYSENELKGRLRIAVSDPDLEVYSRIGWRHIAEAQAKMKRAN